MNQYKVTSYSNHSVDHKDNVDMSMIYGKNASGWIIVVELNTSYMMKQWTNLQITVCAKGILIAKKEKCCRNMEGSQCIFYVTSTYANW